MIFVNYIGMVSQNRLHNIRPLCRRAIALVQILVMLVLAVPVCCYELESSHEKKSISQSVNGTDADQGNCPCCPDEGKTDSDADSCSTCIYCTYYAPLTSVITANYDPSITPLDTPEQFAKLTDVHLPIFVPPQNLA